MFKFNTELFTENLSKIPKVPKPKRHSRGYNYLLNKVCFPTLENPEKSIKINFDKFTMDELNQIIDYFYFVEFKQMEKVETITGLFEKCTPSVRKTAFL